MVWGISAAADAGLESALSAGAEEEFRPLAAGTVDGTDGPEARDPVLPRRKPVMAPADGPLNGTAPDRAALGDPIEVPAEPGATSSRPDLNLLAQVLRGLQRMA